LPHSDDAGGTDGAAAGWAEAMAEGGRRQITGFSNPTVKLLRGLREKKHRRRAGRFLAEGLRLLTDARANGHTPQILVMAMGRAPHPLLAPIVAEALAAGGTVIETTEDILAKITGKDNPQAVCGVFREFDTALPRLDRHTAPIWLVAQAMRDPGNLGTMLRTGDAVGAGGLILLDDCVDPFSAEAVRASMGAVFTQRIAQARWEEFLPWLRGGPGGGVVTSGAQGGEWAAGVQASSGAQSGEGSRHGGGAAGHDARGGQLVAASLRDAVPYRGAAYAAPCFLMVGNESQGLPEAYEAECDLRVTLPMRGRADSLNAAVAAAVLAYEALAVLGG